MKDDATPRRGGGGWDRSKGASRMLSFAAARAIVRKLKLKSKTEWEAGKDAMPLPPYYYYYRTYLFERPSFRRLFENVQEGSM